MKPERLYKGGLISESFSLWLKSPNKTYQITPLSSFPLGTIHLGGPQFEDWSKSDKLSDIKLPLEINRNKV